MTDASEFSQEFDESFSALLEKSSHHPFKQARAHLNYGPLGAYIRIGPRFLRVSPGAQPELVVQIANVEAPEELRGQKLFSKMLARILSLTDLPVFIEQVLTEEFSNGLKRRGFVVVREDLIDRDTAPKDLVLRR